MFVRQPGWIAVNRYDFPLEHYFRENQSKSICGRTTYIEDGEVKSEPTPGTPVCMNCRKCVAKQQLPVPAKKARRERKWSLTRRLK